MRDARSFRMKHGRADADERDRDEDEPEIARERKEDETDERKAHSDCERERLRAFVRERADKRLEQRSRELIRERDEADVAVVEPQLRF